jgi:hypothetical protein
MHRFLYCWNFFNHNLPPSKQHSSKFPALFYSLVHFLPLFACFFGNLKSGLVLMVVGMAVSIIIVVGTAMRMIVAA